MSGLPKLRSDLVSSPAQVDGATVYTVKDPIGGKYFRLREPEYWLIHQFDGKTPPEEISQRFRDKFNLNISASDVTQFAAALDELLFLETGRAEQVCSRTGARSDPARSMWQRILYLRIRAFTPGRWLDLLTRTYRPFHRPFWFAVEGLVILIGLVVLFANVAHFGVNLLELWNLGSLGLLVLSLFILITLHEFAHAVMCRLHGGEVREIGFLLMYFQPCFYCDLSDAWVFEKKSQRLAVTLAGPYFQLVLLAVSVLAWRVTVPGEFINQLAWMLVTVNWINFLFNFNPLIKLDGYYLLSDWLDIPNLRQKAFAYLRNLLQRRLLGWSLEPLEVTPRQRRVYAAYGVAALLYSAALLGYVFKVISSFLLAKTGPGGFILFLAVLLYILKPALHSLASGAITHLKHMRQLLRKPLKLATYLVILAVVLVVGLAVPVPQRVSGDVLVRPISTFTVRLNEFGVLEKITRYGGEAPETKTNILQLATTEMAALQVLPLVKDGETVGAGDTIAVVLSNQITREMEAGYAELERLRGELALLKAAPKREELAEAEARVNAARAQLDQYVRERDRFRTLVDNNLEARDRLETSQSQVDIAEAELTKLRSALALLKAPPRPEEEEVILRQIEKQEAHLAFLTEQADASHIVTPISGRVAVSGRGGSVVSVASCDTVEILVPVADFDLPLVSVGQTVQVKVRSFPARTFLGTVVRIPETRGALDEEGVFPITVLVDNQDRQLRDGMTGYAKIETGQSSLFGLGFRKVYRNLRVEFWSWW